MGERFKHSSEDTNVCTNKEPLVNTKSQTFKNITQDI